MRRVLLKQMAFGFFLVFLFILSSLNLGSVTDETSGTQQGIAIFQHQSTILDSVALSFDHYLQQSVASGLSPGAAVAIVYRGRIILLKGYGTRKSGSNNPVDAHTAFRIGSVSKGFASVLTGMLVNEGYLDWDDKIDNYLKDFHMKDTVSQHELSIRQILSHTTGFPVHTFTDLLDRGYAFERIKSALPNVNLAARPGQVYGYQNVVYSLIGDVLRERTGINYTSLLKEKIFIPLRMDEASADFSSFAKLKNVAFPHMRAKTTWKPKPLNDRYYTVAPASGINASASDMAQWLLGMTGYFPEVIPENTLQEVTCPQIETPRKMAYRINWKSVSKTYYGLGWRIFAENNHQIVYHGGYVEGFRAEIAFDPQEKIGIAALFNSNTSLASQCVPKFFEMCLASLPGYKQQ
jgi:beta-lactamase class C